MYICLLTRVNDFFHSLLQQVLFFSAPLPSGLFLLTGGPGSDVGRTLRRKEPIVKSFFSEDVFLCKVLEQRNFLG